MRKLYILYVKIIPTMIPEQLRALAIEVKKTIILNENGEVLLLQRASTDSWCPNQWEMPGGKVEPGESAEQSLAREVHEETGLFVLPNSIIYEEQKIATAGHRKGNLYCVTIYLCSLLTIEAGQLRLSEEHDHAGWFNPNEALSLNLTTQTRNALLALKEKIGVE